MPRAIFHRNFSTTSRETGVSIRVWGGPQSQLFPEWVIAKAEAAGAATRQKPASAGASQEDTRNGTS